MVKLYLDDVRPIPVGYYGVRSYKEFVEYIENNGVPNHISFDHDLGWDLVTGEKILSLGTPTGYDCAKYLVDNNLPMPDTWEVHSMNPVGKENIEFLLKSYKRHLKEKNDTHE